MAYYGPLISEATENAGTRDPAFHYRLQPLDATAARGNMRAQ